MISDDVSSCISNRSNARLGGIRPSVARNGRRISVGRLHLSRRWSLIVPPVPYYYSYCYTCSACTSALAEYNTMTALVLIAMPQGRRTTAVHAWRCRYKHPFRSLRCRMQPTPVADAPAPQRRPFAGSGGRSASAMSCSVGIQHTLSTQSTTSTAAAAVHAHLSSVRQSPHFLHALVNGKRQLTSCVASHQP